jgi:arylsulfatase A-like enzyme
MLRSQIKDGRNMIFCNTGFPYVFIGMIAMCGLNGCDPVEEGQVRPNVIIVLADDLGYGDLRCYGNAVVKTPGLDAMAAEGLLFKRFYAAAPVCSPTRGSLLTGRHPYRYGIPWAGRHPLPAREITLAEAVKSAGYAAGHFGKWHLGGLSRLINQSEFPGGPTPYSPPWENGFDVCFSTESMMPTYNPYYHVGGDFGTDDYRYIQTEPVEYGQVAGGYKWKDYYWTGPGQFADSTLNGCDSRLITDRAISFIQEQYQKNVPFLCMVWFHAPHTPVVAGNAYRAMYPGQDMQSQHWYGAISAMDEQVGRLRDVLRALGIAEETLLWFMSDNGPSYMHDYNSAGGLRGKKAELYEGGIRVPSILEWPGKIPAAATSDLPVSTSDIYPTVLSACGIELKDQPELDGKDVLDLLISGTVHREDPILFQSPLPSRLKKQKTQSGEQFAVISNELKLISVDNGETYQLYDLQIDPSESTDLSAEYKEAIGEMKAVLEAWRHSCRESAKK